ncbi:MAG: glutamyl-tRNA(Gln) amidotransferase subunit A [Candidatus Dojkabacteria bacterium]|nr:MAG: glutamyl-tRNA(Gln) amidotransferase subunit A [Candidatus Dojkabacteria bacterium]
MRNSLDIPKIPAITEMVNLIKKGFVKPTDLVKEHIERIKNTEKNLNAFITILEKEAFERAKQIETEIKKGNLNGKLLGIPFTVKDLYLVEDTITTFASQYMKDFVAPFTSTVVQKALDEGAILIGKTNCDPWGFGGSGENSGFGPSRNPYDLERVPGGSSSGSAASLAAGIGFFSLGTDTGGSVRLPANFCGLYGYKPTYGRNSRFGIGVMASSFDTPGFFARYVEDIELLEKIFEGVDENDQTTDLIPEIEKKKKLKFGIPVEYFEENFDKDTKEAIDQIIQSLKSSGYSVENVSIPSSKFGLSVYYILVPSEISSNRARYDGVRYGPFVSEEYEENLVEGRSKYFEDEVKRRIMIGTYALSAGYGDELYLKATKVRNKIKQEFDEAFKKVDILLAPTSPSKAFKLGEKINDPISMYLTDLYTVNANITGIPAINIPLGIKGGLPIGMQLMAQRWNDEYLFQASRVIRELS